MKITLVYEFDNREFEFEVETTIESDKDDLYEEYYDEAYEAYLDAKEMAKDIYAYYGVSRGDF